jgi:hypothetical protein
VSYLPSIGFKSKVIAQEGIKPEVSTSGTYSFNAEQIGDYNCEAWTADSNMFKLPEGITWRTV